MLEINEKTFFTYIRRAPFGGRLTEQQVSGVNDILAACKAWRINDERHVAYILATVFHETGGIMQPVREGFAKTDAGARKIVAKRSYGKPDAVTGHVYYGRGHVQLTWADNYHRMGKVVAQDLYEKPDLALRGDISAAILVCGMSRGMFTGKSLRDYFNEATDDALGARRIINKMDKSDLIAGYHTAFLGAITNAQKEQMPDDVSDDEATPDKPSLSTDKTTIGAIVSAVGAGGSGLLSAVNNAWALGAVVVVGVGILLFLSGRLEIRRKAGA